MARRKSPLFLAPASYRQRRLRDAARLLPVFGLALVLLPMAWTADGRLSLTSGHVAYFFGAWIVLIVVAALFAPGLQGGEGQDGAED